MLNITTGGETILVIIIIIIFMYNLMFNLIV